MDLYLIRHTSVDVPAGYSYGQTDVPLRETFEVEAATVKEELNKIAADKVYTSPLSRCVRLATYCGFADAGKDDRIKELNFGSWEMKSWDEVSNHPHSEAWFKDWIHVPTPGGESFKDQYNRVASFLDEIRSCNDNTVFVFAHGGVLACAQVYAGIYDISEAFKHLPSYGEIIKLTL